MYDSKKVSDFISREVYACISDMAEYLFGWDNDKYALYEEWDNLYEPHCPECGEYIDINNDAIVCPYCHSNLDADSLDLQLAEIYEYWLVSPYFGEKLRERGAPVLERFGAWVWGRTSTGQAIALDGIVHKIVNDVEVKR